MSVTVEPVHRAAGGAALLAALLTGACALPLPAPQQREQTATPSSTVPGSSAIATVEAGLFAEVNAVRRGEGLNVLQRLPALDRAARAHARELAERGVLDHESTDAARRTPGLRVTAEGVAWLGVAENLAAMTDAGAGVPRRTATLWLGSAGHRGNMLSPTYTHTGVGVAVDGRGVWYMTQLYVLLRSGR